MDNFALFGQLALQLHNELRGLFYLALPVALVFPPSSPDFDLLLVGRILLSH